MCGDASVYWAATLRTQKSVLQYFAHPLWAVRGSSRNRVVSGIVVCLQELMYIKGKSMDDLKHALGGERLQLTFSDKSANATPDPKQLRVRFQVELLCS